MAWGRFGGYGKSGERKRRGRNALRTEDRELTRVEECDECPWTPSQHCCLRYQIEEDSDG